MSVRKLTYLLKYNFLLISSSVIIEFAIASPWLYLILEIDCGNSSFISYCLGFQLGLPFFSDLYLTIWERLRIRISLKPCEFCLASESPIDASETTTGETHTCKFHYLRNRGLGHLLLNRRAKKLSSTYNVLLILSPIDVWNLTLYQLNLLGLWFLLAMRGWEDPQVLI